MITDRLPRNAACKAEYFRSDELRTINLPPEEPLREHALSLKEALKSENKSAVQKACNDIAKVVSAHYNIAAPPVRVLSVRPQEITETSVQELYGDYDPNDTRIRVWMRTAVQKKPTSFGTLLSTLLHEICHHLDVVHLDLTNTYHTRGFYERAGLLYHHAQGTPVRRLVWIANASGTYRIDWAKTMRGHQQ